MIRRIALSEVIGLPLFFQAQMVARLNVRYGHHNKNNGSHNEDEIEHRRFPSVVLRMPIADR
jgi:hypothetical protein